MVERTLSLEVENQTGSLAVRCNTLLMGGLAQSPELCGSHEMRGLQCLSLMTLESLGVCVATDCIICFFDC